ncbi:MAG: hypothetical protein ACRDTV_00360, partial [Mycobacterium sp.]
EIQCGKCRKLIGEIKRDGEKTMALRRMVRPEPTVPRPQIGAVHVGELDQRRAERDTHVLRPGAPTADGRATEVMKQRRDLLDAVAPVDVFSSYCCPKHGEIAVDKEHLARFAAECDDTRKVTRQYPVPYLMP